MPIPHDDTLETRGAPPPSARITGSRLSADDIRPGEHIAYTEEEVQLYGGPREDNARRGRTEQKPGSRSAKSTA